MGNAQKSAKYLYLSLLGALAVLCIAAGIWWFIRGQQPAEHPGGERRVAASALAGNRHPNRIGEFGHR